MIPWEQHRARLVDAVRRLPADQVDLAAARGLVTAEEVRTRHPVPLFDNSAMDGFAVRAEDAGEGARLRVTADVPAGSSEDPPVGPGEAVRIMTGAPTPTTADAIVPIEDVELEDAPDTHGRHTPDAPPAWITVRRTPRPSAHIRREGEDTPFGDVAVAEGVELTPWRLAAVASAGYSRVAVVRRPRVAVLSTGSELVAPGEPLGRGQIPESNSVLLAAALEADGFEVAEVSWWRDEDGDELARHVEALEADAAIVSGGASVGAFDVAKHALGPLGVRFEKVGIQPGKPQGFGLVDGVTPVFCLPGNPVAVAVSYEMFVRPALRALAGHHDLLRPVVTRRARSSWRCPVGRAQALPAIMDEHTVAPASAGGSGSHLVVSLAAAEHLALVPAATDRVDEGDEIDVMVLS
ncbi:molybdopterin molybdenumtransferase MoeA [Brachybacterium endophyticum]|uniref:Molybdopterin molybdenumtransferase n=1 Tax=Brachybacterium endophyticum TaxID=2182385 RepID=A0A2U2RI09_9MICO|nr:gephyrin-like molybdotransferase Glp [Brachybacterium endophyticum]PWH05486.1 molybdopterin molybdenumtransferase MoeA [Brachybacterium endophyticum]